MTNKNLDQPVVIRQPSDTPSIPIDWSTVTESELKDRANIFSFDLDTLRTRLGVNSNWAKIIVGHIYADHIISQTLRENLKNPGSLGIENRQKYLLDKLQICESMYWVDPVDAAILRKLNKLRNNFAHTLSFNVTKKEIYDFKNLLPKEYRELADEIAVKRNTKGESGYFRDYIRVFIIMIDIKRQSVLRSNYLRKFRERELGKAMENARRVIRKAEGLEE